MKYVYPAIFTPCEEGGFTVTFPDLPGCVTEGDDLEEAMAMAVDAASGWLLTTLEDKKDVPVPSDIKDIQTDNDEAFVTLIYCDITDYSRKINNRAVKKTLSIPFWLNELAKKEHINFSGVLQEALKDRLQCKDRD